MWVEAAQHQVAVVFGREDRGLTNEELHKCHFHVHIPANPEYSSLNVAAALQVIAYEVRMSALAAEQGASLGVLIRPPRAAHESTAATLRLGVTRRHSGLSVELMKGRGLSPRTLELGLA